LIPLRELYRDWPCSFRASPVALKAPIPPGKKPRAFIAAVPVLVAPCDAGRTGHVGVTVKVGAVPHRAVKSLDGNGVSQQ
jgi:hypothetical protein